MAQPTRPATPPAPPPPATPPAPPPPVILSPLLEKVERLIQLAGRQVHRGLGFAPVPVTGAPPISFPVLNVQQGAVPVMIRVLSEGEEILEIFANAAVPPNVRTNLGRVEEAKRLKALFALRRELLASGRTGYTLLPPTASSIEQVELIALNQQVCVKGCLGAEITRLLDALIEVASTMLRATSIFAPVSTGGAGTAAPSPPPPPGSESGPGMMFG